MKNKITLLLAGLLLLHGFSCLAAEPIVVTTPGHEAKLTHQVINETRMLVTVKDSENNPIKGLTAENFVIKRDNKKARIESVEFLETSEFVPLNIVLVVDNSYSMKERRAIKPLLSALDDFFSSLRPIDNVSVVVFSKKEGMQIKAYNLHAKSYHSKFLPEMKTFLNEAFDEGLSGRTYLYEAMVAGLSIIREMPPEDNKFLVVFSDGEDLNSDFESYVVDSEAHGIENFETFAIDYMPGQKKDKFLKSFVETHNGQIWKAHSEAELLPIFKSFSSTLLSRYVVSYKFLDPPSGTLSLEPARLNLDMLTLLDGSPVLNQVFFETGKSDIPDNYVLLKDRAHTAAFHEKMLTRAIDRYKNVLNIVGRKMTEVPEVQIRIIGCNSDAGVEKGNLELSKARATSVKNYLASVWGVDSARMTVEARNLPTQPAPAGMVGSRAENQRVDMIYDSGDLQAMAASQFIAESANLSEIKIMPQIVAEYGMANWELDIQGDQQTLKTIKGTQMLEPELALSLDDIGRDKLVACSNLQARIKVTDTQQDSYETMTAICPVTVTRKELIHELIGPPKGTVAIEPAKLTIEEVTTIDSSPLLNHIFFETGQSDIPARYKTFASQAETQSFSESTLKDTMEKYAHTLNIIGRRLREHPDAHIKIVGCNSHRDKEYNRKDLSRSRAESVKAYLKYIWGIDSARMQVEAQNRPAVASTSSVAEGRAENQRVEIYSDNPAILDTIKSTYVAKISNSEQLQVKPQIDSGYELQRWKVALVGDDTLIDSTSGQGNLMPAYEFNLKELGLAKIGTYENIGADIEVEDRKGRIYKTHASTSVRFIKREERVAQKEGYKVMEKYALILFDFNRADIKDRNRAVLDRIIARINEIPTAKVSIMGHSDTIGKEAYNIDLSKRRAKAAFEMIVAGDGINSGDISYDGAGPHNPLFDNELPEGRALNRTVTVTLEYEQAN
ncbi:MAG: OmpA family protein [Desulfobacterales bacterium]|jgi:outer membrane protein OmpA-like peptidoglycan-associated protein